MMTVLALALSYVLGSVPTGLWLGLRLRGVDIREHGSRNIGATNTLRVLGKALGSLALIGDMGKGLIAVTLIARLSDWEYAPLACGLGAILGHTFPVFLRFRGGKGVATSAGVFLGLAPISMLVSLVVFLVVVGLTRMVSAGSILGAIAMVIALYVSHSDRVLQLIAVILAIIIIVRHWGNIQRILAGTENKI